MNSITEYRNFSDSTEYLHIGKDLYREFYDDFKHFIQNQSIFIIADENTMKAAGNRFERFCLDSQIPIGGKLVFAGDPELTSEYKNIEKIKEHLSSSNFIPVAVGSGTVNDLVKRASSELKIKYAIFATAASVDGYASDGAAILYKGLKQTLPCAAPAFIAADTNVLMKAPIEMTASGYADLLAKNPAGVDWILADSLGLDPIEGNIWKMIQGNLRDWTSEPEKLIKKDEAAFNRLFTGLNVSGFAMQFMKRSRPVSGAEHLMSHIWEMEGHTYRGKHVSHGFKVAIGSLASVALMESVFSRELSLKQIHSALDDWPTLDERLENVSRYFQNTKAVDDLIEINKEKYITREELEKRLTRLKKNWPHLQEKISQHLIPYGEYRSLLKNASCPVKPEDVGLTVEKVLHTYIPAQMMRNRYTILDLAYETGLLDSVIMELKESSHYLK
jgi:glycerol-1-phosphate dehydrogenase [NAD(P)+]